MFKLSQLLTIIFGEITLTILSRFTSSSRW